MSKHKYYIVHATGMDNAFVAYGKISDLEVKTTPHLFGNTKPLVFNTEIEYNTEIAKLKSEGFKILGERLNH